MRNELKDFRKSINEIMCSTFPIMKSDNALKIIMFDRSSVVIHYRCKIIILKYIKFNFKQSLDGCFEKDLQLEANFRIYLKKS